MAIGGLGSASAIAGTSINDPRLAPFLQNGDRRAGAGYPNVGAGGGMRDAGAPFGLRVLDPHNVTVAFGVLLLVLVLVHLRVHAAVAGSFGR